jgi:hypothetical protein
VNATAAPVPAQAADAPFATTVVLAGFMAPDTVLQQVPTLPLLPIGVQSSVTQRLGASERLAPRTVPNASTSRVTERDVLDAVQGALASAGQQQATAANLTGFEWVEIESLLAGRLVTEPSVPHLDALPERPTALQLAHFCLSRSAQVQLLAGPVLTLVSDAPLLLLPAEMQVEQASVLIRYTMGRTFQPIRVLLVRGRAVAVHGLERLVHLARRGLTRALCLVHYGYGLEALGVLPSVPDSVLFGDKPPLLSDFLDSQLAVAVPAPKPVHVVRFLVDSYAAR